MPGQYKLSDEPVPGYRLSEFLGRGGFGEVWKATAPGGTEAALKIISLSGKQGLKEFQALGLVKRIRHPNLVPIVAYWLKDQAGNVLDDAEADLDQLRKLVSSSTTLKGTMMLDPKMQARPVELIIAMGLGEQDLYARLEECQREGLPGIPQKELLGYMEDAARAIDYLNSPRHNLGAGLAAVQHCDIKPFNIMIVGGAAQVCDFGLARMLGDVRKTATAAGTIAYVAPECLTRNEPSSATDQYSLAVTYVELKTGKLPYDSEIYTEVVNAIVEGKLDLSMLSEAERSVIERATAVDPAERYRSTVEMISDLRRSVESGTIAAARPPRRRSRSWLPLGFAVFSLGALAGWYFWPPAETVDPGNGGKLVVQNGKEKDPPEDTEPVDDTTADDGAPDDGQATAGESTHGDGTGAANGGLKRDAAKVIERAEGFYNEENYDDAIRELDPLLAEGALSDPALKAEAYLWRGTCWLEKHDASPSQHPISKAIDDLSEAIQLKPDERAYSRRGHAYLRAEQWVEAIRDFKAATAMKPDVRDYIGLGHAHAAKGDDVAAVQSFSQAIQMSERLNKPSAEAYFGRGLSQSDPSEAIEDLRKAQSLDPHNKDIQDALDAAGGP